MSDLAVITRKPARGMITLRGDLGSAKMAKAIKVAAGQAMPKAGQMTGNAQGGVLWMSPDELLVMVPYEQVEAKIAGLEKSLVGTHHLIADVSDARALFSVSGVDARDVIGRLSPADISEDALAMGTVRRTRLAQVPAAFYRADSHTFELVCFLSVADYVHGLLTRAATQGAPVGFHA